MRDSHHGGYYDRGTTGLAVLARTVVARLVTREGAADRPLEQAIVTAIGRALLDPDPSRMNALRQELRRARVSDADLLDRYFPEVARQLGCAWADDSTPFTDVSIGVARMQAIVRQATRGLTSNAAAEQASATVLVVLPEGEQHSFGVMLLAGQLRRQGISVRLEVGTPTAGLRRLVHDRTFDCAMISLACEEKLDQCKAIVAALKQGSGGRLWVAVGGPLLERPVDVRGRTGADIVTCDPLLALHGALAERANVKELAGDRGRFALDSPHS